MSSETRRILLGSIITGHNAEVIITPPKKAGLLDLFRNPFSSRKVSNTAIDLNTVIEEVVVEQKLDQSVIIAPNAPEIEFRLLAQRIIGAKEADRVQITNTVNIFHEVNERAEQEGKSKLSLIDIPKGVKQGNLAEVVDVAAEHIPFNLMPGSQGLRQTGGSIMAYQRVKDNPLDNLQLTGAAQQENNVQLAVLLPETGMIPSVSDNRKQENMTAVIMLANEEIQIQEPTPTVGPHAFFNTDKNNQIPDGNISYLNDYKVEPDLSSSAYRKDDNVVEVADLDLAA